MLAVVSPPAIVARPPAVVAMLLIGALPILLLVLPIVLRLLIVDALLVGPLVALSLLSGLMLLIELALLIGALPILLLALLILLTVWPVPLAATLIAPLVGLRPWLLLALRLLLTMLTVVLTAALTTASAPLRTGLFLTLLLDARLLLWTGLLSLLLLVLGMLRVIAAAFVSLAGTLIVVMLLPAGSLSNACISTQSANADHRRERNSN